MQRSILASVGVFTVFLCLASPALAGIFTYQFICDLDGAPPLPTGRVVMRFSTLRPATSRSS
jgi:hypothetical protein